MSWNWPVAEYRSARSYSASFSWRARAVGSAAKRRSTSSHHLAVSLGSASSCTPGLRVGDLGDGLDRPECLVGSQRLDGLDRVIQLPEHLIAGFDVDLCERIGLALGVENPLSKVGVNQCSAEQGIELGFVVHGCHLCRPRAPVPAEYRCAPRMGNPLALDLMPGTPGGPTAT